MGCAEPKLKTWLVSDIESLFLALSLADVFETPFGFLMDPTNHEEHEREFNGQRRRFYAMTHEERFIWGATAGMLRALYDRLYGGAVA